MTKEEKDIIMLIRDAIGELDHWSVYHDDKYSEEVNKILEILYEMEKDN